MGKYFNTTGRCYPNEHYMVDIHEQLEQIRGMIEQGEYFCMNRARQYGKTTTLSLLKDELEDEYMVFSISFEGIGEAAYESDEALVSAFFGLMQDCLSYGEVKHASEELRELIENAGAADAAQAGIPFLRLSRIISRICDVSDRPVVLLIDEVDQAGNHRAFLEFLGMLRDKYLKRRERPTFRSVILASVYDIKNLKLKLRSEEEHQYNSPWNIAADFDIDMNFTREGIEGMLAAYGADHYRKVAEESKADDREKRLEDHENNGRVEMDVPLLAGLLYDYTSGYPFLVSRICKLMDEKVDGTERFPDKMSAWSEEGFREALRILLSESNTLFDDMRKKLSDNPQLKKMLYKLLYEGETFPYNTDDGTVDIAELFDYVKNDNGKVMVANRIFETRLYNLFISEGRMQSVIYTEGSKDRNLFVKNGELEAIINGTGNYYVEAETRDERRTDVIVDYLGKQYVVELKIYHGNAYNERGERQLSDYLDAYHLKKGYMLSFNFNKKKEVGVREIRVGDKILVEAVV